MPLISERVVKSKYKAYHTFLSKNIKFDDLKNVKIKNIIEHKERVVKAECMPHPGYVNVNVKLEICFIYYIEEKGEKYTYPYICEEDVFFRIYRNSFEPKPYETDFRSGKFAVCVRNLKAMYDIDLSSSTITIDITGFLIVNLMIERCIILKENQLSKINEIYLKQVALSSEESPRDIKNYLNNLEGISKLVARRIDELEEENKSLKDEIKKLEYEVDKRNSEYMELKRKEDALSNECTRLVGRLKEMEEKFIKEQKRANLLEVENSRNLDELKALRKEHNEIASKAEKNKTTIIDKIKSIIK